MSSVELLEWIIEDLDGNQDILQYEEDFLKKIISSYKPRILSVQSDFNTRTRLWNYQKVAVKSQTFLKYGPLEHVSMVARLAPGKKLILNGKSDTAIISHSNTFENYPWAYFGSHQSNNNRYVETLLIDSAEGQRNKFIGSTPAIITKISTVGSGDPGNPGGGGVGTEFSDSEQFKLFMDAYDAFSNSMNFQELINYFNDKFNSFTKKR